MAVITESKQIVGVKFVQLQAHEDARGRFLETFRIEWFPERSWDVVQTNCSYSRAGVLRGLHYHLRQVDYWSVPCGRVLVGLADLRDGSPTYGRGQLLELGEQQTMGVFIPPGVAHGYLALTNATLIYLVDQYYDPHDEAGVAWNDPTLALPWGITDPLISERDRMLPLFSELAPVRVP